MTSDHFKVAFVCTGNRFRSPLAAALFARASGDVPLRIQSLGTLDLGSVGALPEASDAAARFGVDLSQHRARAIVSRSVTDCDLVLGFERAHMATAVIEGGAPRDRTFTLPELVELLRHVDQSPTPEPVERARELIARADTARRALDRMQLPEVADPLGQSSNDQAEIARMVESLAVSLARALFGSVTSARARAG